MIRTANRVRWLGWGAAAMMLASVMALVSVTVRASLMTHAREIEALLLVGATDRFITRVFVRAAILRALLGAIIGLILAAIVVVVVPSAQSGVFAQTLRPVLADWLTFLVIPLIVVITTYISARITAFRVLRSLV